MGSTSQTDVSQASRAVSLAESKMISIVKGPADYGDATPKLAKCL